MSDSVDTLVLESRSGLSVSSRDMRTRDIDVVCAIEALAHSHPWKRSTFETRVAGKDFCRVILIKGQVIGYAIATYGGGDAELLNIALHPKHQGGGLASLLLVHIVDLVSAKADMMFLEVRVSNQKAIDLYHREGFFETGHRRAYYPTVNGREDALLMACQLSLQ